MEVSSSVKLWSSPNSQVQRIEPAHRIVHLGGTTSRRKEGHLVDRNPGNHCWFANNMVDEKKCQIMVDLSNCYKTALDYSKYHCDNMLS